jgi:hypothetical protein
MKLPSTILLLALFAFSTVSAAENPLIRGSPRKLSKPEPKTGRNPKGNGCSSYADSDECGANLKGANPDEDGCCWKGDGFSGNGWKCGNAGDIDC